MAFTDIIRVTSLANYSWVHAEEDDILVDPFLPDDIPLTQELLDERKSIALSHEVIPDYLVNKAADTAMLYAKLRPGIDSAVKTGPLINAARELAAEMSKGEHKIFVSGGPAINTGFQEATQNDLQRLVPVLMGLIILTLLFALKSSRGSFIIVCRYIHRDCDLLDDRTNRLPDHQLNRYSSADLDRDLCGRCCSYFDGFSPGAKSREVESRVSALHYAEEFPADGLDEYLDLNWFLQLRYS